MFGKMNVVPVVDLAHAADDIGGSLEAAVAKLLDVTEHPAIAKWIQFPKALFLFLLVPGDPESGAFYIYDRRSRTGSGWTSRTRSSGATTSATSTG